jgi:CRISPR-associated protein Csm1
MDEKIIRLAALVHDIGKFWQGTGEPHDEIYNHLTPEDYGKHGAHSKWSASFVVKYLPGEFQDCQRLVLYHHNPKDYELKIISLADWLSSGERRELSEEEEKGKRKETPLRSIFSEIDIGKGKSASKHYYPIKKLDLDKEVIFPKPLGGKGEDRLKKDYDSLWKDFVEEVERIKGISDFDAYFNTLDYLLQRYTWCVPSAVWKDVPDVSLFDHLKTSCAIASCLNNADEKWLDSVISGLEKKYRKEELSENEESALNATKFLLIGGDISGIQKFIYAISSPEEARRGMARRLRGRSFYLNLLNDAIATHILSKLNLPLPNLLWCGGGHFTILAPCDKEVIQSLVEIKRDVNTHLLNAFDSSLALALDWIGASSSDLSDFGALKERLSNETNRSKRQKFISNLSPDLFKPGDIGFRACAVCGMESDDRLCKECKRHEEIGRKIAKARYILKMEGTTLEGCDTVAFGVGYSFVESKDDAIERIKTIGGRTSHIHILKLNDTHFLEGDFFSQLKSLEVPLSYGFSFLGNAVPLYKQSIFGYSILDFADMASLSKGASKLGILKMDVDNLGKIFASGLSKENRTISRISTLSSMLDLFFAGYLNILSANYRVYAILCEKCIQKLDNKIRKIEIDITELEEGRVVYEVQPEFERELCDTCKSEENHFTKVYVVYSGGDDLLILGPWDTIIEVGKGVRDDFKAFACNNESLNVSGGISICEAKFPIGRGVELAGGHLDFAKSHLKDGTGEPMKNSIALFNECVCWDDLPGHQKKGFDGLFKLAKDLERLYEEKEVSKAFVYSLLRMWRRSFDKFGDDLSMIENKRMSEHDHVPLLKYQVARTFKEPKKMEEVGEMIKPYMPWIRIPVSWVSLRMR